MKSIKLPPRMYFSFRAPLLSGFPELLTPPPVRFFRMPSVVGVWIFSGITHLVKSNQLSIINAAF